MAELLPRIVDELNRSHNQANSTPNSNQLQNPPKIITGTRAGGSLMTNHR